MNPANSFQLSYIEPSLVPDNILYSIFSNKELLQYMDVPIIQNVNELSQVYEYLQTPKRATWFLQLLSTSEIVGFISFNNNYKHCTATVSCLLLPEFQHCGYMHEALSHTMQTLFATNKIARIESQIFVHNTASIALVEKCGFQREGLLRKNFMIHGVLEDSYVYAVIMEN